MAKGNSKGDILPKGSKKDMAMGKAGQEKGGKNLAGSGKPC